MPTSHVDLSVVICAYTEDRWDEILAAIASVRAQTTTAREILVVVDHNQRLFERLLAAAPDVTVLESRGERGLSGARNTGTAAATGEVVVFLDDDAAAEPDWLSWLSRGYADPRVIGVGGAPEPYWRSGRPGWFPDELTWVVGCAYRGLPEEAAPVRNLIGANMSFRRDVLDAIGGFRTGVGRVGSKLIHCEDTELCIRARQYRPDAVILYEPRAKVVHQVPANRATWTYFRARCYTEGQSKARVAQFVGAKDGLAAERRHTLRVLPLGVLRSIGEGLSGDLDGFRRAGAIVAGFGLAAAGYLMSRADTTVASPRPNVAHGADRTGAERVGVA